MKKIFSLIITTVLVLLPLSAFEWGGLLSESFKGNATELKTNNDLNFKQSNGVVLWANLPFINNSNWYLATQGSYKYTYSYNGFFKNGSFSQIADLDLLKLNGSMLFGDLGVSVAAGRYIVMDSTTKIFVQNCDGLTLKISKPFYNLGVYAGYTGLLNGNTVAFIDKDGNVESNQGDFYTSTHPYIPVLLSLEYPSLFLNQAFGLQLNGFIDLGTDSYNRFYATANLKGPIYGPFYYNLISSFGFDDFKSVTNFSSVSFMAFIADTTIRLNCEYASGNQFIFKPFKGFNSSVAYTASWAPEYSGVLLPGLDFIYSRKEINIELNGKFVLLYPEDELIIKGISGNLKTVTNIYSDLAFEASLSVYYDLETLGKTNNYSANIGLSIAF